MSKDDAGRDDKPGIEMRGWMDEADFEKDTITFKMQGTYAARAGLYAIVPIDLYVARSAGGLGYEDGVALCKKIIVDFQTRLHMKAGNDTNVSAVIDYVSAVIDFMDGVIENIDLLSAAQKV